MSKLRVAGVENNRFPRAQELHRASRPLYTMSEVKTNIPLPADTVVNRVALPLWQVLCS